MSGNSEFDSKAFLQKSLKAKDQQSKLGVPASRKAATKSTRLIRAAKRRFSLMFKKIAKPLAGQIRRHLIGDLNTEMNYFHTNQNEINRAMLEELREIRKLLEEKRINE